MQTTDESAVKSTTRDAFDVNDSDALGNSPLLYTVFDGDVALTSMLLDQITKLECNSRFYESFFSSHVIGLNAVDDAVFSIFYIVPLNWFN
ncbi:unnamed protein product [Angiostrongylus costaricensis]|uniref:FAS1 domain-containing protein n=1 Tax=Angiostrongylus costaricensis TaxID=334426 RepID=A0A0R3PE53_ANGCS|nr:unnamed protein product [Angiostrongylus costaricensis]